MRVIGIDPGIHGGLALVNICDGGAPVLVDAIDIPVIGVKAKERVDVLAIRAWVQQHRPQHAFIERAQAMPRQGASSGFKYGRATGAIEAAIACCEVPPRSSSRRSGKRPTISAAATRKVRVSARSNCFHPHTLCSLASAIITKVRQR